MWRKAYLKMRKLKRERRKELAKAAGAMEIPKARGRTIQEEPFMMEILMHDALNKAAEDIRSRSIGIALERLVLAGMLAGRLPEEKASEVIKEKMPHLKKAWEEVREK